MFDNYPTKDYEIEEMRNEMEQLRKENESLLEEIEELKNFINGIYDKVSH